ncbi:MAG: amidohydrolase [Paraglaciecola sp.]|uniref:amidohydrolase n=1 Tax=Paraglaciecola sp. TaxID=1920173 RepID=UPI00273D230B|nr:amidohydrolase [Paraglaciecola sp.]MDP5032568.1 amidohydrolase [Paraglaciecola sp.]MDP5129488.1 amidohydrolase [Paraglaciecola sp.]
MRNWLMLVISLMSCVVSAAPTQISNVRGYTLDNDGRLISFSNLIFDGGKVIAIGNHELNNKYPEANKIDGQNKVLLPGLIDAHGHVMGLGETLLEVDLRDIGSANLAAQKVRDYANQHSDLTWITGRGWNQVLWPDKAFPTAQQLDEYISDRPVVLSRVDGHASWVNSKALALAGITKETLDPPGGKIIRDQSGQPTGVLIDNADLLVTSLLPRTSIDSMKNKLNAAGEHLLSVGITSTHDAGISEGVYDYYQQRVAEHSLPVRIYPMISASDPNLSALLQKGFVQDQYDYLSIRSVKAYGDGALGSRGAALLAPYSDAPQNSGLLLTRESEFKPLFDLVLSHGFQLNFHAIGDRANRKVLDQFEDSFKRVGGQDFRNRVEHAQVVSLDDIPRFLSLSIIPSMQPTHATSDKNMAEDRIGKTRLKGAYAWHTFLEQGSPLAFGSDFPVELANPFFGLHAAVTRQDRENQPVGGWIPEEAMTITQAFRAFTLDAAYAAHQDKILGGLTVGKWADFILVDQDIFTIKPQDIWQTQVLQTWIGGQIRFSKAD